MAAAAQHSRRLCHGDAEQVASAAPDGTYVRITCDRSPQWVAENRDDPLWCWGQRIETGDPTAHPTRVAFLVSSLVNPLAEDKRFELLRVSPTRFPILLLTVR
jgi:hypothetical protein